MRGSARGNATVPGALGCPPRRDGYDRFAVRLRERGGVTEAPDLDDLDAGEAGALAEREIVTPPHGRAVNEDRGRHTEASAPRCSQPDQQAAGAPAARQLLCGRRFTRIRGGALASPPGSLRSGGRHYLLQRAGLAAAQRVATDAHGDRSRIAGRPLDHRFGLRPDPVLVKAGRRRTPARTCPRSAADGREASEPVIGRWCSSRSPRWVLEDDFPAGRPPLHQAGVQLVASAEPCHRYVHARWRTRWSLRSTARTPRRSGPAATSGPPPWSPPRARPGRTDGTAVVLGLPATLRRSRRRTGHHRALPRGAAHTAQ